MLPEIKKVLYATDLSRNSAFAFRYAMSFAERQNAEIVILYVLEEISPNTRALLSLYMAERQLMNVLEEKRDMAEKIKIRLNAFCEQEYRDAPSCTSRVVDIEVTEGYPAEQILKKADEMNCDAIIMGTHGKGTLAHTFLGSVAQKVLKRIRKPVFVIPLPKDDSELHVPDI
jgi:nucleotide-binding universal stress UspA family protein